MGELRFGAPGGPAPGSQIVLMNHLDPLKPGSPKPDIHHARPEPQIAGEGKTSPSRDGELERGRCWMFQRFHAMKERKEEGFTLIELLVVILIIAILAAIAIPVFLNQRKKGWVSQSESALKKDRKSTRLNSSHANISYAVFCLKKKKKDPHNQDELLYIYSSP